MHGTLGSIFRYDALRDEIVGMLIYCLPLPHAEICNVFNVAMACMSLVTVLAMWACGGEALWSAYARATSFADGGADGREAGPFHATFCTSK